MRRVNVKLGIKQRIQDILGSGMDNIGTINDWSIQKAMISNSQRVVAGIVGEARNGRIMRGLNMSYNVGSNIVTILGGSGFTPEGNVVFLNFPIRAYVESGYTGDVFFYLKHTLAAATEGSPHSCPYGKETEFNNQPGLEDIVFDDYGLIQSQQSNYTDTNILEMVTEEYGPGASGYVYIGKAVVSNGVVTAVHQSIDVGIRTVSESLDATKVTMSYTFDVNNFASTPFVGSLTYQRVGSFLAIAFSKATGTSGGSEGGRLKLKTVGGGNFPPEFFGALEDRVPCIFANGSATVCGSLIFDVGSPTIIKAEIIDITSTEGHSLSTEVFETSGQKGIEAQTIWLYRPL